MNYPERIPYDHRINSQLSVAKYSWGIILNWTHYVLDFANAKKEIRGGEEFFYPDLITAELEKKQIKESQNKK